ncbi:MAG: hypothetical protein KDA20_02030 [Phycisphaerales bacterium]|nr:hypothetical protein [Phycisphaerales bacterium]
MTAREFDEGPSPEDIDRLMRNNDHDFDDGLFPDERAAPSTATSLHWTKPRIAAIALVLLIIFLAALLSVF